MDWVNRVGIELVVGIASSLGSPPDCPKINDKNTMKEKTYFNWTKVDFVRFQLHLCADRGAFKLPGSKARLIFKNSGGIIPNC